MVPFWDAFWNKAGQQQSHQVSNRLAKELLPYLISGLIWNRSFSIVQPLLKIGLRMHLRIHVRKALLPGVWDYIKVDLYLQIIHHFFPHDLSFNLSPFVKWLKGPFWRADTHRPSPTTHFWQENSAIPPQPISWPISAKGKKYCTLMSKLKRELSVLLYAHWMKRCNSSLGTYNIWHQAAISLNLM